MRTRGWIGSVLIVLFILDPRSGWCQGPKATRARLQTAYTKAAQAYRCRDIGPTLDMVTADFRWKLRNGTIINRNQMRTMLKEQLASMSEVLQVTATIERLDIHGKETTVLLRGHLVAFVNDDAGKRHRLDSTDLTRDYWRKTPQGWKIGRSISLKAVVHVDGKKQSK